MERELDFERPIADMEKAVKKLKSLTGNQKATAHKDRYETEVRFFMYLENKFYQDMTKYLRGLGVKQLSVRFRLRICGYVPSPTKRPSRSTAAARPKSAECNTTADH